MLSAIAYNLRMKRILCWAAAPWLVLVCANSHAQTFPTRPIRLIVGSSAGGGGDGVARVMAAKLTPLLGQQVVIDNRPGAAGNIGTELVARAPADGYTLLFAYTGHVINPALFKKLPFDPLRDFAAVGMIGYNNSALVVNAALPVHTVKELIALARARPGKLTAGAIPGGSQHLATEMLKSQSGVDFLYVPYKGNGMAIVDLISGRLQVLVAAGVGVAPHIRAGKLRAIAVTGPARMPAVPEVPTLAESGMPGLILDNMYGLYAPAGVVPAVLAALNREVSLVMNTPDMRDKLAADGAEPALAHTVAAFRHTVNQQITQWDGFIRTSGVKLD